jgi:hypothetical protein
MDFYSSDRNKIFEMELTKLFLANNRPCSQKMIEAKSVLLSDTLAGLSTDSITAFFTHIRDNEDGIPTDGKMLMIYRATLSKFKPQSQNLIDAPKERMTPQEVESIKNYAFKYPEFYDLFMELLENDDKHPSKAWMGKFWAKMGDKSNFKVISI